MQNFTYQNTVKIVFGRDTIKQIGQEASAFGKKALLVYGHGSVKKNGLYNAVVDSLKAAGLEFVEYSGVSPNPRLSHAQAGADLAKQENVDLIVALGGGSVIDESKAIALGALYDGSVWDFYSGKATAEKALPICDVLTVAATGTEMNGGTVITNEETQQKFGLIVPCLMPKVSILDPTATFSLGAKYTAFAGVDIFAHIVEGYITNSDPETPIQDAYAEGLMRTVMEYTARCVANGTDYDARANMMWASTMAWNGQLLAGVENAAYPAHLIGHSMSCLYDTAHGASLSVAMPCWMRKVKDLYKRRLVQFARNVMGVTYKDEDVAIEQGVARLEKWYESIGAPITFTQADLPLDAFDKIVDNIAFCAPSWGLDMYTRDFVADLLKPAAK